MSTVDAIGSQLGNRMLNRFVPEPKNRVSGFGQVLSAVGKTLGGAAESVVKLDPAYQDLINKQIEVQTQLQVTSMESNIEKSKHETQMSAIRNIRSA